jgi:hypothetical protein
MAFEAATPQPSQPSDEPWQCAKLILALLLAVANGSDDPRRRRLPCQRYTTPEALILLLTS